MPTSSWIIVGLVAFFGIIFAWRHPILTFIAMGLTAIFFMHNPVLGYIIFAGLLGLFFTNTGHKGLALFSIGAILSAWRR